MGLSTLKDLHAISNNLKEDGDVMPIIFFGHGSPMNAIEDNEFTKGWKDIVSKIPIPKMILCVSAHWETKGTFVTAMDKPATIHDFGGFPQALFDVQYPAPGDHWLAEEIKRQVKTTNIGLDMQTVPLNFNITPGITK